MKVSEYLSDLGFDQSHPSGFDAVRWVMAATSPAEELIALNYSSFR